MLAGRRTIEDPLTGRPIDLPMLVPAFTSKGFPTYTKNGKIRSKAADLLEATQTAIRESLLVSAYDIHHGYIPKPTRYFQDKVLIFLDSGGYELAADWDSTEPKQGTHRSRPFSEQGYRRVLSSLPTRIPIMIANYDWSSRKKPLLSQIRDAQRLFTDFSQPNLLSSFILKPGKWKYLNLDDVLPHLEKLRFFKCLGVVEKELGEDLLARLVTVAKLRDALEEGHIYLPIHVWGGLDPIATPLYFFAGADIFDGVSWLRYAYHNGMAVCCGSHCVLDRKIGLRSAGIQAYAMTLSQNIAFLGHLKDKLCQFVLRRGRTFKMFDELTDIKGQTLSLVFKQAFEKLVTKVPSVGGGG